MFHSYQKLTLTCLIRNRIDAKEVHDSKCFSKLDQSIQGVVKQLIHVRAEVKEEGMVTRDHIDHRFEDQAAQNVAEEHLHRVLRSLFFDKIETRFDAIKDAHQGTFAWIFERNLGLDERKWSDFIEWLENSESTYWIEGKAGAGKSTLMRYIYTHEKTKHALHRPNDQQGPLMVGYFLWESTSDPLQHTTIGLLRALLYQIVKKLPDTAWKVVTEDSSLIQNWTERALRLSLKTVIESISRSILCCLFVDGLDELQDDVVLVAELIEELSKIPNVKICVSSRPYNTEINIIFRHCPKLRMQDLTSKDTAKYIGDHLEDAVAKTDTLNISRDQLYKLQMKLVEKAEGVFIWVRLAMRSVRLGLLKGDDYEKLSIRIKALPRELDDLYRQLLGSVDSVYRLEVARYLRVLLQTVELRRSSSQPCIYDVSRITLLTLALLDVRQLQHYGADLNLEQKCKALQKLVNTQCGGFLETKLETRKALLYTEHYVDESSTLERRQIISPHSLSIYDENNCELGFTHRTALDFLKNNVGILDHMDGDTMDTWSPLDALARANIRRMNVLPWAAELFRHGLMKECVQTLLYIRAGEYVHKRAFTNTISAFADAVRSLKMRQSTEMSSRRYHINFTMYHVFYWDSMIAPETDENWLIHMPTNDVGLYTAFNLKYTVDEVLKSVRIDKTYLLQSALAGFEKESYYSWDHESYTDTIENIVEAGADPNHSYVSALRSEKQHPSHDNHACSTIWQVFLAHVIPLQFDSTRMQFGLTQVHKALSGTLTFLRNEADPNAMAESRLVASIRLGPEHEVSPHEIRIGAMMNAASWLRFITADFAEWTAAFEERGIHGDESASQYSYSVELLRRCCSLREEILKFCKEPRYVIDAVIPDFQFNFDNRAELRIDTDLPQIHKPLWELFNVHTGFRPSLSTHGLAFDEDLRKFVRAIQSRVTAKDFCRHENCTDSLVHERAARIIREKDFFAYFDNQVSENAGANSAATELAA